MRAIVVILVVLIGSVCAAADAVALAGDPIVETAIQGKDALARAKERIAALEGDVTTASVLFAREQKRAMAAEAEIRRLSEVVIPGNDATWQKRLDEANNGWITLGCVAVGGLGVAFIGLGAMGFAERGTTVKNPNG